MLYEVLAASSQVRGIRGESHVLWEAFHPERAPGWISQEIRPEEVTADERRFLYRTISMLTGDRRYLDKAPANALRVPYLLSLFADARFVCIVRDGRAVISSLLTGWRSNDAMFPGKDLGRPLAIDGYGGGRWKFVVPSGWEAYTYGHSLVEVCAFQWSASVEALEAGRASVAAEGWLAVRYEDFVSDPVGQTTSFAGCLELEPGAGLLYRSGALAQNVTKSITAPGSGKWRLEHAEEIERIAPSIAPLLRRLGYEPDIEPGPRRESSEP